MVLGRADVEAARERIDGYVRRTPVLQLGPGAFGLDAWVTLKLELTQHTGSFKPRGAFNKLLSSEVPDAGVIAAINLLVARRRRTKTPPAPPEPADAEKYESA